MTSISTFAFRPSAISGPFELVSKYRSLIIATRKMRLAYGKDGQKVYRASLGRTMEFRSRFILSSER